jgi:hypothetical protein
MSGRADRRIRWTMTGCVGLMALIAGPASYLHTHLTVESRGQPGHRPLEAPDAGCAQVPGTLSAAWRLARLEARVAQEREHGRDTAVHLLLAGQVQLGEDRVDVLLD